MSIPTDGTSLGSENVGGGSNATVIEADFDNAALPVNGAYLQDASYARDGDDLVLNANRDDEIVVRDFFGDGLAPNLTADSGHQIAFETVQHLAGPLAPAQYAQADGISGKEPIGQIEDLKGDVRATHTDGTSVVLAEGDKVFQGDVIETGNDGQIGIRFADETKMALDSDARIVLDELVYSPGSESGSAVFSLIKGAMVFVSGEIAHNDPDAMMVKTPTATIGIRGTKAGLLVNQQADELAELFIDLFTEESELKVDSHLDAIEDFLISVDNPAVIVNAALGIVIPTSLNEFHKNWFGAERNLPGDPLNDDDYDPELEQYQGRLALLKTFLEDFFDDDLSSALRALGPLQNVLGGLGETILETGGPTPSEGQLIDEPDPSPPVALDDTYSGTEGTVLTVAGSGVLGNDTDVDAGATITVTSFDGSSASGGAVTVASDGAFTYTPVADFTGSDTFTYTITDDTGLTDSAVVTIEVGGVNDPPVALDDTYSGTEDSVLTVAGSGVLGNDTDIDTGATITVTSFDGSSASGGTVTVASDGAFTYTPVADFNGSDTFTYTITDDTGLTDSAVVTIEVGDVNDPPVALDDTCPRSPNRCRQAPLAGR